MSIIDLVRPNVRELQGYSSARMEADGGLVRLNANENPWAPPDERGLELNRYPDPQPAALVSAMADLYDVAADQVLATRGSDEAIDLLVRAFCEPRSGAIMECPPCFSMYRVAAGIQDAQVIQVSLDESWEPNVEALVDAHRPGANLLFLCSPNNPTGNALGLEVVRSLCDRMSGKCLVVVDEAYQEFSAKPSATTLLREFSNLAVLRTLSKAFGLAGIRCGALVASPLVVATLRKIMAPYPLPTPTTSAALSVLSGKSLEQTRQRVQTLVSARSGFAEQLRQCPAIEAVWAFEANFVLVRTASPGALVRACASVGILIRDVSSYPGLDGCVRITIGSPQENATLIDFLSASANLEKAS